MTREEIQSCTPSKRWRRLIFEQSKAKQTKNNEILPLFSSLKPTKADVTRFPKEQAKPMRQRKPGFQRFFRTITFYLFFSFLSNEENVSRSNETKILCLGVFVFKARSSIFLSRKKRPSTFLTFFSVRVETVASLN